MMGNAFSRSKSAANRCSQRSKLFITKRALTRVAFITAIAALTSGCVTNYGVAAFRSVPDGVQVFDMEDGSVIGVTPVNFKWKSGKVKRKYMNVRMHKDGYEDAVKSFWLSLGYRSPEKADKNPQLVQFELKKVAE